MSSVLVLGPVWSIGEGLVAAFMFTHIRLLPGVGPEVGLEVLQARVSFRAALKLQSDRDREIDSETTWMQCYFVCSWVEKRAGQQKKALRFRFHIQSTLGLVPTYCGVPHKSEAVLHFVKKGLLCEISKLSVRCGRALCLVCFVETRRSLCLAFVFTCTVQAIIWYSFWAVIVNVIGFEIKRESN